MPKKRRSLLLTALVLSGISSPALLRAQSVEGRVNGAITDPTGKLVPGAQVVLKSLDTNAERTTTATDTGTFVIPSLPPGRYSATVSSPGFQQYVIPEFRLQVNEARTFDIEAFKHSVRKAILHSQPSGISVAWEIFDIDFLGGSQTDNARIFHGLLR